MPITEEQKRIIRQAADDTIGIGATPRSLQLAISCHVLLDEINANTKHTLDPEGEVVQIMAKAEWEWRQANPAKSAAGYDITRLQYLAEALSKAGWLK